MKLLRHILCLLLSAVMLAGIALTLFVASAYSPWHLLWLLLYPLLGAVLNKLRRLCHDY